MPALAVVAADHRIIRSTETFRHRCEGAETMCASAPELEHVLTGQADVATLNLGELSVAVEAVTDAAGRRQAILTLPPVEPNSEPEPPLTALRGAADASQAIVWVKDLDGNYLFANQRYAEALGTTDDRLEGAEEPIYFEDEIPGVDDRPALSMLRFALRDQTGCPVATCGVAAPIAEAQVARTEAVRLMQLERWNRLDPLDVRAELLEQWHLQRAEPVSRPSEVPAAPTPAPPPTDPAELLQTDLRMARRWADRAEALQSELEQARAAAVRANQEAERWRSELEQTRLELSAAQARAAERERDDELERMHARLRSRLGDFETSLDGQAGAPGQMP